MNKLEEDLIRVLTRIEKLTNGLSSKDDIKYNYNKAISYFKIAASSPNYKTFSNLIIERSSSCIRKIFENPKNVLINIKSYLEFLEFKSGVIQSEDEDGNEILADDYQFVINEVTVDDQMREELYKNDILQELIAYKSLFETFNQKFEVTIKTTSRVIANRIASIEIGEDKSFIKTGESTEAFIDLISNPFLELHKINKLKIEIGVTADVAGYIFKTLNEEDILNINFEMFDVLNCFYNGDTKLNTKRIRSDCSKFKPELNKGNSKKQNIMIDLVRQIETIKQLKL